ncbi:MAG: caspase family protein [Rubrivivax sp.]|nr:caspase family protein [Rubrivivax sp.]
MSSTGGWRAAGGALRARLELLVNLLATVVITLAMTAAAATGARAQADPGPTPQVQRRIALVIGNDTYESSPLANSINDARAMAGVLRDAGFAVMLLTDVDQRQFQLAVREFGERLKASGSGGAGLFYYAGHGVQIKGRNFLIPVRSHIAHEDEVAYAAIDAQSVLDKMDSAGNGTNIVILDACRNNPFTRSYRSGQQGLAQMDAPVGTLVAYATAPGSVAVDSRPGMRNGLYTTHLLEAVRQRGLKVEEVFKQVRGAVLRASGNKQQPWESTALVGDFYFHPPREGAGSPAPMPVPEQGRATPPAPSGPAAATEDAQAAIEDALWEAVKDSRSSAELFAYLNRFPMGRHARDARLRLLDLAQPGGVASAGVSATPGTTPGAAPGIRPGPAATAATPAEAAGRMSLQDSARTDRPGGEGRGQGTRRNPVGFAQGDRFGYQKTDYMSGGRVTNYLWTVDRIEPDGSLWVNEGRQRLDAAGQRLGGNDEHTGAWVDFAPPLPIIEVARRGAGVELPFSTTVTVRDAENRVERIRLQGKLSTATASVRGPRGMGDLLRAVRVEVELSGEGQRSDGARHEVHWRYTYWISLPLLMPVSISMIETAGGVTRQSTRHELVDVNQLSLADAASGVAR